jgi:hypothetical protein
MKEKYFHGDIAGLIELGVNNMIPGISSKSLIIINAKIDP